MANRLFHYPVFRKFYVVTLVLASVISIGVLGFYILEDYSVMEAFYMTIITISTVGFKEVRPLSYAGQLFTSVLIITSFGTFAYGVSLITGSLLSGELTRFYRLYRLEKEIHKLKDHVIICGFGRNGRRAARKLMAYNQDFLVIEASEAVIDQHLRDTGIHFLEGDATEDHILNQAGIERAKSLISTMSKDADNLYTVISARQLRKDLKIISRASSPSAETKLRAVGADHVVMPEGVGGAHMATLVMSPGIVEFLDSLSVEGSSNINLEEVLVSQLTDNTGSLHLKDLALRQKTGCTIIGMKTPEGEYIINPGADTRITTNSYLFVLGNPNEIQKLNEFLHS